MFSCVIARWVFLARFDNSHEIRRGHHTRATDWPFDLIVAELARLNDDVLIMSRVSDRLEAAREKMLAFAMGTHERLGANSKVQALVMDVLRTIVSRDLSITVEQGHLQVLHEMYFNVSEFTHTVVGDTYLYDEGRLLLKSEMDMKPSFEWPGRKTFFFCRRGWFSGVDRKSGPIDMVKELEVRGVFESVPHVFCQIRFPICRPFPTCRHLLHVSINMPTQAANR